MLLKRPAAELSPADARRRYGAEVYAMGKRRLARRELRQYPIPSRWWDWPRDRRAAPEPVR